MKNLWHVRSDPHLSALHLALPGPDDDRADEARQIGALINCWLLSLDETRPDARSARRSERKLHDAIKASQLYGKILSFAGLNIWVDKQTSDGLVMSQECMNL